MSFQRTDTMRFCPEVKHEETQITARHHSLEVKVNASERCQTEESLTCLVSLYSCLHRDGCSPSAAGSTVRAERCS